MSRTDTYIVGVDGGGTGCRVRLADAGGREVATATAGAANINTDFAAALAHIEQALTQVYAAAGRDPERRAKDVAWLGLAGAGVGDLARRMENALGFARARVTTDCATTVEGALGGRDGVVGLTGTGSFFVRRRNGRDRRIGGWGYELGDECSGAWLGRELLRRVLLAHDGLEAHSALTRAVLAQFGDAPDEVVRFAHGATPGEIATYAPKIVAARAEGDPVALEIMETATRLYTQRLDALETEKAGVLCLLGGLAEVYAPLLPARFQPLLRPPAGNALDGAVALARRRLLPETTGKE